MEWARKRNAVRPNRQSFTTVANAATDDGGQVCGGTVIALSTGIGKHISTRSRDNHTRASGTSATEMRAAGTIKEQHREDSEGIAPAVVAFIFEDGKVDVSTLPLRLPDGHHRITVAGDVNTVLSDAQVLAGKYWGRGDRPPTRDLYDYAVASEVNPKALEPA